MQIICEADFKFKGLTFEIIVIENLEGKRKVYEAWIRAKNYGVMDFMFGCNEAETKLDDFLKIVSFNVFSYADSYIDDYVDESEVE